MEILDAVVCISMLHCMLPPGDVRCSEYTASPHPPVMISVLLLTLASSFNHRWMGEVYLDRLRLQHMALLRHSGDLTRA